MEVAFLMSFLYTKYIFFMASVLCIVMIYGFPFSPIISFFFFHYLHICEHADLFKKTLIYSFTVYMKYCIWY